MDENIITRIRRKYNNIKEFFDETTKRLWAATEAQDLGRGGITAVHQATGIDVRTIRKAINELRQGITLLPGKRQRQLGGGKKKITETHPQLLEAVKKIVDPVTRGDPMNPLKWTSKSIRKIAAALQEQGHQAGITTVRKLLKQLGYSLQANRKTREGTDHPDRDAQFQYINEQAKTLIAEDQPVISVDTKKKENLGNFSNKGGEYEPKGHPVATKTHDFPEKELGKAIPYGIYDLLNNKGFVSVGVDHDTAEFAVNGIRTWWNETGKYRFTNAKKLLITADSGGSNSYRTRLWKVELQKLANELEIEIMVCHFPPGTSKWNKVEHRLFSYISKNWRGRPLVNLATVIELISNTTTEAGLTVQCLEDKNIYKKGIKISDKELAKVNLKQAEFHGEWNYSIKPNKNTIY